MPYPCQFCGTTIRDEHKCSYYCKDNIHSEVIFIDAAIKIDYNDIVEVSNILNQTVCCKNQYFHVIQIRPAAESLTLPELYPEQLSLIKNINITNYKPFIIFYRRYENSNS